MLRFLALLCLAPASAFAHFGLVLPSTSMLEKGGARSMEVSFAFVHPFEQYGMPLAQPDGAAVFGPDGSEVDLRDSLRAIEVFGEPAFVTDVSFTRPGAYVIGMAPAPYWEPSEDAYIVHYTKTYIAAFGDDTGWDRLLDLPVEIEPLSKPFGLWAGNAFQGIVRAEGTPMPFAEVEVEFWNTQAVAAPSDLMITQTVKADRNGVFTYVPPGPGWWGFAALVEANYTIKRDGVAKPVEEGGVLWVHFEGWP